MRYNPIFILFTLMIIIGCSKKSENITLELKPVIESDQAFPFDILENISYVPLETNSDSYISDIWNRVEILEDKFYILNFETDVKIFKKTGEYVGKFGTRGNGPMEYILLMDIAADETTNTIHLDGLTKLLSYDPEGNYLSEIKIPGSLQTFACYDNMLIFPYGTSVGQKDLFRIYDLDEKGMITDSLSYPNRYPGTAIPYWLAITASEKGFFLKHEMSDEMLMFDKSPEGALRENVVALTDFGNYVMKPEYFTMAHMDKLEVSYRIDKFFANERYIVFNLCKGVMDPVIYSYIYDKTDGKYYKLVLDSVPFTIVKMTGNSLIALINPLNLLDNADKLENYNLKETLLKVNENSNPVIAIIDLKP